MRDEERLEPWDEPGAETPPELVRALRALGNERPTRARLARMGAQLEAMVEAGAAPAGGPALTRGLGGKSLALRLVIAALGLGGVGLWLALTPAAPQGEAKLPRETNQAQPTFAAPESAAVEAERVAASLPAADSASSGSVQAEPRALREQALREQAPSSAAAFKPGPRPRPTRSHAATNATKSALGTGSLATATLPASQPQTSPATLALAQKPAPAPAPAEQPTPPPARKLGEVELLLSARTALKHDPQAALKLLDEHTQRFASGTLAPEREVLVIEALRLSGNKAQAEQRLRQFQAQYPHSLHLLRLQPTARNP
jgi:hypothetical protein